jgi:hypothetical protein
MRMAYVVHILAGGLGLLSGYVALYATKGAPLHRKAGTVFVFAMLTASVTGLLMAVVRGVAPAINIPAALLTACLVITALTTIRPPSAASRWLDLAAMPVSLAVGLTSLSFGLEAIAAVELYLRQRGPMVWWDVRLLTRCGGEHAPAGSERRYRSPSRTGRSPTGTPPPA